MNTTTTVNPKVKCVYIAADHQGQHALKVVQKYLMDHFDQVQVINTWVSYPNDDYPDVTWSVIDKVKYDVESRGILICGSGVGVAMVANRDPLIRAMTGYSCDDVRLARQHENTNVLCLGAWSSPYYILQTLVHVFMTEEFHGGRHLRRIYKASVPHN